MAAFGESAQTMLTSLGAKHAARWILRLWLVREFFAGTVGGARRGGPQLVALDDLQWAEPTTLLALRTLIPELAYLSPGLDPVPYDRQW